jgi:hypothetical protein
MKTLSDNKIQRNDKKSSKLARFWKISNILGFTRLGLMTVAGVILIYVQLKGK